MKRTIVARLGMGVALVAGFAIAGPGIAWAQNTPGVGQKAGQGGQGNQPGMPMGNQPGMQGQPMGEMGQPGTQANVEGQKHLAEVELYLTDAMNGSKVLYQTSQMPSGKLDTSIAREDLGNVQRSIDSALNHVNHLKTLPEAKLSNTRDLDAVATNLKAAEKTAGKLRGVNITTNRGQFASLSSQLYGSLQQADQSFDHLAQSQRFTRLDQVQVPVQQPVGGHDQNWQGNQPSQQGNQPGGY